MTEPIKRWRLGANLLQNRATIKAPRKAEMNSLSDIGNCIRTQDNRCTENPMFCVQELKRDYGYSPDWVTETVWFYDGDVVPKDTPGAVETGYKDRWETVMVAFTEEGCKDYLRLNGHNHHGETRIYVQSWNRCREMILVRELLIKQ